MLKLMLGLRLIRGLWRLIKFAVFYLDLVLAKPVSSEDFYNYGKEEYNEDQGV